MCKGRVALGRPAQLVVCFLPVICWLNVSRARVFNFLTPFFFLMFDCFFKNQALGRMYVGFCLLISLDLLGQITGCSRTNYGAIRTNYGRYPQTYSDKLRALSTDLRCLRGVLAG